MKQRKVKCARCAGVSAVVAVALFSPAWAQPQASPPPQVHASATDPKAASGTVNIPAQEPAQTPDKTPSPTPEHHGTVLFQSHGEPPRATDPTPIPPKPASAEPERAGTAEPVPDLTDRERSSFTVTRYELDLRLQPAKAGLEMHAGIAVRNSGTEALRRLPLQISSTLHWESASEIAADGSYRALPLVQHTIDTDADHTGQADEAILTLPEPLAPGALVRLDLLYAGTLPRSTGRLRRLGAPAEQATEVDWDGIGMGDGQGTALRGFGNVLWYPVVSPQLFLGSGNELFRAVGAMRRRGTETDVKLRLRLEYSGDAPAAVYFCGRREEFKAESDANDVPVAHRTGIATAEFASAPSGFRTLSLFVVDRPEQRIAALPTESAHVKPPQYSSSTGTTGAAETPPGSKAPEGKAFGSGSTGSATVPSARAGAEPMLAVETRDDHALPALAASAQRVAPLLMEWFGARPLSALTVLDAGGQPFQDGALLRAPIGALGASTSAGVLAHSLTPAWVQTGEPWMDEGLGQFMELLWTEQTEGRPTALAQLSELMIPVGLAEPAFERPKTVPGGESPGASAPANRSTQTQPAPETRPARTAASPEGGPGASQSGEALVDAESELFYRRKAAAVWWMLRDLAGEQALRQALSAWRTQAATAASPGRARAEAFQHLLERTSGKDLGWFFDNWVLNDRGLPDLTLVYVTPRQLPAGQGHDSGWLVAVTVRNDGGAAAEVPLVVRSGSFSSSRRLRIPGFGTATERILVEAPPTEVVVNDGSTPEVRASIHTRSIVTNIQ